MVANSVQYSTNLVIPESSDVKDAVTNRELTYAFKGMQALAIRIDEVSGALSLPQDQWSQIDPTISVTGGDAFKFYCIASADIAFGQFVTFVNNGSGGVTAKPADATSYTTAAYGYCLLTGGVTSGEYGEFRIGPGINYGISGMTPGAPYFLSSTLPGAVSNGPPVTAGNIYQCLGVAITSSILSVGSFNSWRVI